MNEVLLASTLIIVIGIIAFIIEAIQYRNFKEAVKVFNAASTEYFEALKETRIVVDGNAETLHEIGVATQRHDETDDLHTTILELHTLAIKTLTSLFEGIKMLDMRDSSVVLSKSPVAGVSEQQAD